MTPDEVIEQLKKIGVEISRPTLSRYEKQNLIPSPERGSLGRAGGRWTDYPENTVEEAYVVWKLMHGDYGNESMRKIFGGKMPVLNPATISVIREIYFFKNLKTIASAKTLEMIEQEGCYGRSWSDICIENTPPNLLENKIGKDNWTFLAGFEILWREELEKIKKKMSDS